MYNKRTLNKDTKASKEPKSISTPRDIIYDPMGQWTNPYQPTRVPSSNITMQGVPYPVLGIGSTGQQQMMYPGAEYMFPGSYYVDEFPKPIMQDGGSIDLELTDKEIEEYRRGGYIVEEYAIGGEGGGEPTEPKPAFKKTEKFYDEARELEEGRKLYKSYKEELLKLKRLKEKEEQDVRNKRQNILNIAQSLTENPRPTRTNLDYIAPSDYYCNTRSCEIFQDAGLTIPEGTEPFTVNKKVYKPGDQVPIIPGNMQMKGVLKNLGFLPVDESNLKPGDLAQEEVYKSRDYQGNTFSPRFVPSHSMIKANKDYYNAPGGDRTNYEITPISFYGEKGKDWRIQGYRYEGALPYYNNLLKDVQSKFEQYSQYADIPVEQLPIKRDAYLLNNLSKVPESILPSSTVDWQNKRKEEIKNSEFSSKEKRKLYKSFKQQGGTIPKFQTGDEKKPLPNLFNFDPTPEYVGYQGNIPASESTRVVNTYRPTQQEIKATKEYTQKVGATAQAIRNKTGVSQKEAMQQAEQVLDANSRVPSEAKPYANTKQAQERDAYVFDEGMNARDYFRYPLQFLSGNLPTQEERIQDRIRITDPRTSRLDKFMGTVGEAGSLAPEALLNTGIGLAFAPANLSKLGMVADAVSPIGNPFHPDFIKSINKAGDYLTTQTPLKNAYKLNPRAPKLGQYNRVVGQDAIDDIIESGLVRVNENAGVATDLGPFGIVNRTTPYPSFGKANPQQKYIDQVISQGKTPYVISTDRPMRASTLARHGKGKTQFPINDEGKYISGFPASEAQVYEATPHWLRGYKPIETPTSPFNTRAQNDILLEQARRSGEAPLPSYMEPYISRRYTPASKEQDIFESFLSPEKQAELRQSRTQTFDPKNEYKQGGMVLDLSEDEIRKYLEGGYVVEELQSYQEGSEVISEYGWDYKKEGDKYLTKPSASNNWVVATGKPLEAIKQKIYKEIPYTKENKKSDYITNVERLINKGYSLEDLVEKRVGTKAGLSELFPDLVKKEDKNMITNPFDSNMDVADKVKKEPEVVVKSWDKNNNGIPDRVEEEPAEEIKKVKEIAKSKSEEVSLKPTVLPEVTSWQDMFTSTANELPLPTAKEKEYNLPFIRSQNQYLDNFIELESPQKISQRPTILPNVPAWQDYTQGINEGLSVPEYIEAELDDNEIKELEAQGYTVEEVAQPWLNSLQNNVSQQSIYNTDNVTLDPFGRTPKYGPTEEQMSKLQEFMKTSEEKGLKSWKPELISLKGLGDPAMGPGGFSYTLGEDLGEKIKDPEGIVQKGLTYVGEAPWSSPSELPNYFSQLKDTKDRSEGTNLKEEKVVETPKLEIDVIENKKQFFDKFPIVKESSNNESFLDDIEDPYKKYKPSVAPTSTQRFIFNKDTEEIDKDALYNASNRLKNKVSIGKSYEDTYGQTYSKQFIDMSDGIFVTYQPRQEREDERTDVNNSLFISDYLYDQDFTDGYKHEYAENELNKLKNDVLNNNKTERKFATVRIPTENENEFIAKVVNIKDLTADDFENNNVYRQSWAKLSDLEISNDGKKVKLNSGDSNFKNQGILLTTKQTGDNSHTLRVSGGKGNYGDKWLEIDKLNEFGPYLGGTVTIVSDDGKIVRKVTGGLKDILNTAFEIKKATNNKEVHFLQSDSGSMNVKPLAKDGVIDKRLLGTQRNKEDWAGASEILLNK